MSRESMNRSFAILYKLKTWLVLLTALILSASCTSGEDAQGGGFPPPLVEVGKAASDLVRQESEYIARFESRKSVTLSPRVGGIIRSINTSSGNVVGSGQVLIKIEA